jgi:hypothetical protein
MHGENHVSYFVSTLFSEFIGFLLKKILLPYNRRDNKQGAITMSVEDMEVSNPMSIIQVQIVTTKGVVFSERVAENVHNACWSGKITSMMSLGS